MKTSLINTIKLQLNWFEVFLLLLLTVVVSGYCWCFLSLFLLFLLLILIRERSSITSARLGEVGGLSQNADTADALEGAC